MPKINSKSERLSLKEGGGSQTARFDQILEKGKEYERKLSAKRIEKKDQEIEDCTFKPKVIVENTGERKIEVHKNLYEKGLALWKARKDQNRSTE